MVWTLAGNCSGKGRRACRSECGPQDRDRFQGGSLRENGCDFTWVLYMSLPSNSTRNSDWDNPAHLRALIYLQLHADASLAARVLPPSFKLSRPSSSLCLPDLQQSQEVKPDIGRPGCCGTCAQTVAKLSIHLPSHQTTAITANTKATGSTCATITSIAEVQRRASAKLSRLHWKASTLACFGTCHGSL